MRHPPNGSEQLASPVLRPLAELDVPGSYYIAALAVDPARRSGGIGTTLLRAAETEARALGYRQASLAVFSTNVRALRLYRRLGYREVARRPLVQSPYFTLTGEALMLVKSLGV